MIEIEIRCSHLGCDFVTPTMTRFVPNIHNNNFKTKEETILFIEDFITKEYKLVDRISFLDERDIY